MLIIVYPLTPPRSSPHPHPLKSTFEKFIPQFSYVPGRVEASETAGRVVDTAYTVSLHEADILEGANREECRDR